MSLNISPPATVTRHREKTSSLLEYAKNTRHQGRFNDVTIRAGDKSIKANRMVVSCYCPYFDQIFASEAFDQITDLVYEVNEVDGESLELLIQFIYTGHLCIDSDKVFDILSAAYRLEMEEAQVFCFDFIANCITSDNCIAVLKKAKQCKNFTLVEKVHQHISDNYQTIIQSPTFLELKNDDLCFMVFQLKTSFQINDEMLVRSLLIWTKHDEENRIRDLYRIVQLVTIDKLHLDVVEELLNERLIQNNSGVFSSLTARMKVLKTKEIKILSVGGFQNRTSVKAIYGLYDITNDVYPNLPVPLQHHRSIRLNDFIYCIGGYCDGKIKDKVFRLSLNETDFQWEEVASLSEGRFLHDVAVLNDTLVICGGNNGKYDLPTTECYQPNLNKCNRISSLKQARNKNESATSGGCLYTMGGCNGTKYLSTVERLDGLHQTWSFVSSMQTSRYRFAVVECDDFIYAIGGWNSKHQTLKSVEKYNCATNEWIYVSEMKIERRGHSACVMRGKIYVVGGRNTESESVKEIECYDPSTDKWDIVAKVNDELFNHSLIVL